MFYKQSIFSKLVQIRTDSLHLLSSFAMLTNKVQKNLENMKKNPA